MKPEMIQVDEEGRVGLNQFDQFLDISRVAYYAVAELDGGRFGITFYDEDQNLIPPYVGKNKVDK